MSNIDTRDSSKNANKSSMWNKLKYALTIIALLNLNEPWKAENIISDNQIPENTEAVQTAQNIASQATDLLDYPDIVSNIEKRTWVKLPEWYEDIIRNFIKNHDILKNNAQFIEDFVVKEMQTKRWINDQNQELFIYCAMWYEHDEDLYDWNDWNKERMSQFESVLDNIEECQNRYHKEFLTYLEQSIDNSQQSIDNSQQRINNARQESMKQDSIRIQERMVEFYDIYKTNPNIIKQDDLDFMRKSTKEFIADCIKNWIDYKAILLKEVWDPKKVDEILKFYEINN